MVFGPGGERVHHLPLIHILDVSSGSQGNIALWVHDLAAYSSCPVARDVREETGIEIGAVHYHSSQPWPFPANIMLGLHAGALTTEITVDYGELEDAGWCERDWLLSHKDGDTLRMPRLDSIARRLIEDWLHDR
jgi:hypothetical protein